MFVRGTPPFAFSMDLENWTSFMDTNTYNFTIPYGIQPLYVKDKTCVSDVIYASGTTVQKEVVCTKINLQEYQVFNTNVELRSNFKFQISGPIQWW